MSDSVALLGRTAPAQRWWPGQNGSICL